MLEKAISEAKQEVRERGDNRQITFQEEEQDVFAAMNCCSISFYISRLFSDIFNIFWEFFITFSNGATLITTHT